jgi:hypothetical protein
LPPSWLHFFFPIIRPEVPRNATRVGAFFIVTQLLNCVLPIRAA